MHAYPSECGLRGGLWDLQVEKLVAGFDDADPLAVSGIFIGGEKYMMIRGAHLLPRPPDRLGSLRSHPSFGWPKSAPADVAQAKTSVNSPASATNCLPGSAPAMQQLCHRGRQHPASCCYCKLACRLAGGQWTFLSFPDTLHSGIKKRAAARPRKRTLANRHCCR